ncbi:MAG: putative metal-binding motif-containing protein, partial [Myxococcota bacterium]
MRLWTLLLAALAIGCNGSDKVDDTAGTDTAASSDLDGDGFTAAGGDCDDDDPTVHPEAEEIWYDGVDQNCDLLSDYDQDADGVDQDADCDDTNGDISPDAPETCNGIDDDCDGEVDESGTFTAYLDADADGFGTGDALGTYCELPAGTADNGDDCDDTNAAVSPAADEVCDGIDNDCDGTADDDAVDGTTVYSDTDMDGFGDAATRAVVCELPEGVVADATDCDDTDAASFPGATEVCDLEDNNCDGAVDEGAIDPRTYYGDADGDGYGDAAVTTSACGAPEGYVEADTDCDDADAARSPGATEVCDGLENDCDAEIYTDAVDALLLYADLDLDGFGDDATRVASCAVVDGYVDVGGDCDDTVATVSPAADEVCDTVDNNCDGAADESTAIDAPTWYLDADTDGHGSAGASAPACAEPEGFAASADDCDDLDATVYPEATERCDERDNDCDGSVDDGAADATAWYADADGDSFGDASAGEAACEQPEGYVADDRDCDDADALSYPGAAETCDGQDQDCDGAADDDPVDGFAVYADADGDGYGDAVVSILACEAADGWTTDTSDCDDAAAGVNPGADEVCGGADDNCDGTIDEPDAVD